MTVYRKSGRFGRVVSVAATNSAGRTAEIGFSWTAGRRDAAAAPEPAEKSSNIDGMSAIGRAMDATDRKNGLHDIRRTGILSGRFSEAPSSCGVSFSASDCFSPAKRRSVCRKESVAAVSWSVRQDRLQRFAWPRLFSFLSTSCFSRFWTQTASKIAIGWSGSPPGKAKEAWIG